MVSNNSESNKGKWNEWYKNIPADRGTPELYAEALTYRMAASFLADVATVEDWGCGRGGFRAFCLGQYVGVDGSQTPFADKIVDLCEYKTSVDGILIRHVLEHNYQWKKIIECAVKSFKKKLCIIVFTPFAEESYEIAHNKSVGVDVPDLCLSKLEVERYFKGLNWTLVENIQTKSQYGVEHVYFVWRSGNGLMSRLKSNLANTWT